MLNALDKARQFFPQCDITADRITWHHSYDGDGKRKFEPSPHDSGYIDGWKDSLTLDGDFTLEELETLVNWMKGN